MATNMLPLSSKVYRQVLLSLICGELKSWVIYYLLWYKNWREKNPRHNTAPYLDPRIFLGLVSQRVRAELDHRKQGLDAQIEWSFKSSAAANAQMQYASTRNVIISAKDITEQDGWVIKEMFYQLAELPKLIREEVGGEYAEQAARALEDILESVRVNLKL